MSPSNSDKLWEFVRNQLNYGNNQKVKEIEKLYGPFQFQDRVINDGVITIVLGPVVLDNGATYYGQW